jgi:hypothetical protein
MILGVNEDCVVRAGSHAGLTADADRFVEINNSISALEHRRGGTGGDTWRMRALIAARDLMRATSLRKNADVDVLHIRPRYRERNQVF